MSERVHLRTCPLCEAMCGLEVTVEDDRVIRVRPDQEDVWSRGYICPKGTALGELHHDPDRLRRPVVRRGGKLVEVGWDEAFAAAHEKIRSVIDGPGPGAGMEALAVYIGNPVAHNLPLGKYVGPFMAMSAITNVYSAGTVDQWPKNVASALMYGGMWTIPVPDIDRTDFLLVLGANPQASQGSLLAAADVCGRLREIGRRGGRVVVVDPRRTGTAEVADEWLPIRPGTDAAFLMAMVNVLVAENRISLGALAGKVNGLSDLITLCRPFTPEAVSASCGIPAQRIRELARELAGAERAAVYGRIGTCTQEFGTLASWLVEVLNILTGNLDREGGSMFANPARPRQGSSTGQSFCHSPNSTPDSQTSMPPNPPSSTAPAATARRSQPAGLLRPASPTSPIYSVATAPGSPLTSPPRHKAASCSTSSPTVSPGMWVGRYSAC